MCKYNNGNFDDSNNVDDVDNDDSDDEDSDDSNDHSYDNDNDNKDDAEEEDEDDDNEYDEAASVIECLHTQLSIVQRLIVVLGLLLTILPSWLLCHQHPSRLHCP